MSRLFNCQLLESAATLCQEWCKVLRDVTDSSRITECLSAKSIRDYVSMKIIVWVFLSSDSIVTNFTPFSVGPVGEV